MRAYLDSILRAIRAERLNDEEFEYREIKALTRKAYTFEVYDALLRLLYARETEPDVWGRLKLFFRQRGVRIAERS